MVGHFFTDAGRKREFCFQTIHVKLESPALCRRRAGNASSLSRRIFMPTRENTRLIRLNVFPQTDNQTSARCAKK
jgi:hypothetical protein